MKFLVVRYENTVKELVLINALLAFLHNAGYDETLPEVTHNIVAEVAEDVSIVTVIIKEEGE